MSVYDKRENKQPYIDNWKSKGAEWCATQLWAARKECSNLKQTVDRLGFADRVDYAELQNLREANNALRDLLKENGIVPQRLIVQYRNGECTLDDDEPCWADDCEGCSNNEEWNEIRTYQFYSWYIVNDTLCGLLRNLKKEQFELIRLIDDETKTVLYEKAD